MTGDGGAKFANEGDTNTLVMAGLDPAIHQSLQDAFISRDGLPGQARQ
jgi:hypothetical protein